MKKVIIVSRHAISNYGSFLQALALQKKIESLGYEAEVLNYINTQEKSYHLCTAELKHSRWNDSALRRAAFYACNMPNRVIQYYRFDHFRKKSMRLSREYGSLEELRSQPPHADIYCTGSDQVWNETINDHLDWVYFLDFLPEHVYRISYAGSFGKDTIREENRQHIQRSLAKFQAISVREDSGRALLADMGLLGDQVLDPTLLLTADEWRTVRGKAVPPAGKYVLLYQIHRNDALVDYAKRYANHIGCPVINVSVSFTQKKKGVRFFCLPSYEKLLALFDGAYCVVTDSFHATAFSINLKTPFVTMLPTLSTGRNQNILRQFGLENRAISDENDFVTPEQPIDYEKINTVLVSERQKSIAWLKDTLEHLSEHLPAASKSHATG